MNLGLARMLTALGLVLGCTPQRALPPAPPVEIGPIKAPLVAASSAEPDDDDLLPVTFSRPTPLMPQEWLLLGPFENELSATEQRRLGLDRDFLASLGGEAAARITLATELDGGTIKPRVARADGRGVVDLAQAFGGATDFKVAYAHAVLHSERALSVRAHFGSDDGAAVWLNGAQVHRVVQQRAVDPDDDRFDLALVPGENRLLIKVENGSGGWAFALKLYDTPAQKRLEALELRRQPERLAFGPEDGDHLLRDSFPALAWQRPSAARAVFGARPPRVRWFGPNLEEVERPRDEGRYLALIEAQTRDGHAYRRMLSFAKLPATTLLRFPLPPGSEPAAPFPLPAGLPLNERQRAELSRHLLAAGGRSVQQGEDAALLAATLHELAGAAGASANEPAWLQSSFIRNEEHQLALRMKLDGRTPKPLPKPERTSTPAPVLRSGSEAEAGMKPGTLAKLRAVAAAWAKADPTPFVALVARRGVVFMHEGFGGFDKHATFRPASIGKSVAGLLFARAVDRGLLQFDAKLSSVFPEYGAAGSKLPPRTAELTFRHCFLHVAGLTKHRSHGGLYNVFLDNDLLVSDIAFADPLRFFIYDGDDLNLTGKALELTTGRSIFRLLYEQLQEPFGEPVVQLDLGAGDRFNAMYLAKLGQMLLQDGAYGQRRLFSPGFVKQLWPRPIAEFVPGFSDPKLEGGIGFSWMVDPSGPREQGVLGPNVLGHGAASGTAWRVAPDHELVVVLGRNQISDSNEAWIARFMGEVAAGLGTAPGGAKLPTR